MDDADRTTGPRTGGMNDGAGPESADDRAMVSPAHLRRAEEMCRLRLAFEYDRRRGGLRQRRGDARFAVSNRIEGDVRLAHATMRRAQPSDFPPPTDLTPEQQTVHRAAALGYLALFGVDAAQVADERVVDPWGTDLDAPPIRLVGNDGVAVQTEHGDHELRVLQVGPPGFGRAPLDDVDLHLAVLRTERWVPTGSLRVLAADLLELSVTEVDLDVGPARAAARAFVADRVERIRGLVEQARPRVGADCSACGFVPRCPAHRGA